MNIFERIPKELFSILASPNKAVYSDALLVLHDAFQENLKIPKDTFFTMLRSRLENALVYSSFEEEGIEAEEAEDLSGKSRFLIRKLKEKGWIDIERDSNFSEYIIIPEYSIRIIELLKSIADGERASGFSYVYDTYSSLKLAHEDEASEAYEKLIALNGAYDKTHAMTKVLKRVYHNVNRYVQQLIDSDDINEILAAHFDDFYGKIIEAHIKPLKIKDSIPKYKNPIKRILNVWLEDNDLLDSIARAAVLEKRTGTQEECRHDILRKIYFVKESYDTIEHDFLSEIDERIRKYTRATTKKIEYLTNTDRTVQGNLVFLLNALAENREDALPDNIGSIFDVFQQNFISENSLYRSKRPQQKTKQNPVLIHDDNADISSKIKEEYRHMLKSQYSKRNVLEYMERMFGDNPVTFSDDMDVCNDYDYILSLLAVLHGNTRSSFYRPSFMDGETGNDKYTIPKIRFERRKQK